MTPLAHIGGVPVEESLALLPALLATGALVAAHVRGVVRRRRP